MKIGIIGGGASGMMLAAQLVNRDVTIIERNKKLGKKLLLTGNGKCNFTNLNFNHIDQKYNNDFAIDIYNKFNNNSFIDFFNEIGIVAKVEKHRGIDYVYPNSNKALSVYYCLLDRINSNGINIIFDAKVKDVKHKGGKFVLTLDNDRILEFEKIVLATGGMSYSNTGSDGSGYSIAKSLGHSIIDPVPGLSALNYKFEGINNIKLSGKCRVNAIVSYNSFDNYFEEFGEIQFNEDSISGIPILNLSTKISRKLKYKENIEVFIDFAPSLLEFKKNNIFSKRDVKSFLLNRKQNTGYREARDFLCGYLPDEINEIILKLSRINNKKVSDLTDQEIDILTDNIVGFRISISKLPSFDYAQITLGGVDVKDIDVNTLESKIVKNLYFTGEIMDIDGICGGYNLQLAYSTAAIVSKSI